MMLKNILKKIIAVYVIIASLAILLKIGDVYAEQVGDFPNQLCTRLSEDMIYGSTDQSASGQVTSLQRFLVNRGYSIGSDTFGIFGYGTQDAVSKFQTNSNLIPTGFVGENTRTVIQNISCGTTPSIFSYKSCRNKIAVSLEFRDSVLRAISKYSKSIRTDRVSSIYKKSLQRSNLPASRLISRSIYHIF
jgi:hypothetical protein